MPGVDWIPGISQLKAGIQLITGDVDGAAETQKNFLQECPVVSQATSLVQLVAGDSEGALETQKRCLGTVNNVANGLPVVGHVKGVVHHLCGDSEGGNEALYAASRTTVVMGSGAVAAIATGGLAAIPAGIAAGGAYDIASSVITEKPQGYIAAYDKVKTDPSAGNIFDAVCVHVGDGLAGYSGGEAATKLANKIEMNKFEQAKTEMKVANKAKISTLEAVRDVKQQQLDTAIFHEPKITTGEAVSMGNEINALTKEINTLQGSKVSVDLKNGNHVSNNLSSTSKGGVVISNTQDEKENQGNSTGNRNNANSSKYEKQEDEDDDLEKLDIFKTIHDSVDNALKHDFYKEEEGADKQSKKEKESKIQKFTEETNAADATAESLTTSSRYSNSTTELLNKDKVEFERKKNKNQLKHLISQRLWLHVCMPEEFTYTSAILLNNAFSGLYHSVLRHHDEWANFIPGFETEFQHSSDANILKCLRNISKAEDYNEAGEAIRDYLEIIRQLGQTDNNRFIEVQSSFFDLQLDLYSFIQNNVTYENYLGEGVTINNEVRVFFKVKDKQGKDKVMAVGVSSNNGNKIGLFAPENDFGDHRSIRRIETVFTMSWDKYLKQKISKIFDKNNFPFQNKKK